MAAHHRRGAAGTARRSTLDTMQKARSTHGLAYVTEDRKTLGLVLNEDIKHNITLANLDGVSRQRRDRRGARSRRSRHAISRRAATSAARASISRTLNLSGGNQQKVVLSKWLFAEPKVLILDEPTRGIDVGAKYEIYTIINDLAAAGQRRHRDLLGDARAAGHVRPHLRDERGQVRRRNARPRKPVRRRSWRRSCANTQGRSNEHRNDPGGRRRPQGRSPRPASGRDNLRDYGLLGSLLADHGVLPVHHRTARCSRR